MSTAGRLLTINSATLAAITGNIGILGGHVAGGTETMAVGAVAGSLPVPRHKGPSVHVTGIYDALLKGKSDGFSIEIKIGQVLGGSS